MKKNLLPNFIIIGAARSATSSLNFYLSEHPDIYMSPVKEAQFFGFFDTDRAHKSKYKSIEEYSKLFSGAGDAAIIGEATPTYLALPESAYSIKKHCPGARLLASLRNPVDRAFSYYEMSMSKGHEKKQTFQEWIDGNEFWLSEGGYYKHLKRYYKLFDKEKLKIVLFDDIQHDSADVVAKIHSFLGVEVLKPASRPEVYNHGGKPKNVLGAMLYKCTTNRSINKILRPMLPQWSVKIVHRMRARSVRPGEMPEEMRSRLTKYFREDILRTQDLIGRDLNHWIDKES